MKPQTPLQTRLNLVERLIRRISPRWALNRAQAELALRTYEGASTGRRTDGWVAGGNSANSEIAPALARLRYRSRELSRNGGWATSAVNELEQEIVGVGIRAEPKTATGKSSPKVAGLWREWAETTACDIDGRHDFYGLQALVARQVVEAGECLVRAHWNPPVRGLPVPLQLQVIEPDLLDETQDYNRTAGAVMQGVEFDQTGRRTGYHLFAEHPGETFSRARSLRSSLVPEREIAHVFRQDRPGQVRGVPWAAPVMIALRDFLDYGDAVRLRAKIANCLVGVVTDMEAPDGRGVGKLTTDTDPDADDDLRDMEPGTFDYAGAGRQVTFSRPPAPESYDEVARVNLREIAAGYLVPYERLTGDYMALPFSAARLSELRFRRNVRSWRSRWLVPQLCSRAWIWFLEAAELAGRRGLAGRPMPIWTPPRWEMMNPAQELKARKDKIRAGISTLSDELRAEGVDPERHLAELAEDYHRLDTLGLVLDSDVRQDTARLDKTHTVAALVTAPEEEPPPPPPEPDPDAPDQPDAEDQPRELEGG